MRSPHVVLVGVVALVAHASAHASTPEPAVVNGAAADGAPVEATADGMTATDMSPLEAAWFEPAAAPCADCPSVTLSTAGADLLSTRGLTAAPVEPIGDAPDLAGFTVPVTLNENVREYIAFFQQRGRFIFARWYARMHRYQGLILPILEEEGLPPELIYICMIESGFNPDAVSRAAAVGPWQFVSSTGKEYRLRTDAWIDERRDPIKATRAAARHFADLHARFGTWELAFAAYNAGVGRVSRAIRKANTTDFWRLVAIGALPSGSNLYVSKTMAAMIIGREPTRYGFADLKPDPPLDFGVVEVPGGLDLQSLARSADVPYADLAELNPELLRGFTPPDGVSYPLRVPTPGVPKLEKAVVQLEKRRPGVFVEHRVRFGERLRDIARAYGVRRSTLRRLNDLPRGEPQAGRVLVVPRANRKAPGDPIELLVVTDPELQFVVPGRKPVYFPVRRRMQLDEVAAFFNVGPGHIALWNALDPEAPVQRGMVLRIYVPDSFDRSSAVLVEPTEVVAVTAGSDAAENALSFAREERKPTVKRVKYTVKNGDNLWKVAKKHGVTVAAIRAENGLGLADTLSVGQTLVVPKMKTPRPRGKAARRKPKAGAKGRTRYKIRSGDNLWKIARKFGVTVKDLRRRNGLNRRSRLRPGQTLMIP